MFTGIVQARLPLAEVEDKAGLKTIVIDLPDAMAEGLAIGASVAIEGVCLTVTEIDGNRASFDIIDQTLTVTSLAKLQQGTIVNVERSAKYGDEVGGHIVSGHIDTVATIINIEQSENNQMVWYAVEQRYHKYIFERGFVALNGCSLTVAKVNDKHEFAVGYIPETLRVTTHGFAALGDTINVEIDRQTQAIVDTVERTLAQKGLG